MGVAGDQRDPGQAAGDQVAAEREPAGAVLRGGHLQAQDLPETLRVDRGRDHRVDVDGPATLPHFEHQRVSGHERVRAGVEWSGPERRDLRVEVFGHLRDLGLGQPVDAEGSDQLLHPPGRHPEQVGGGDDADQRRLGPTAVRQQPVREVAAPTAASGSPRRSCPPGCPSPDAGNRCGCWCAPRFERRTGRCRSRQRRRPSTPRRTTTTSPEADQGSPARGARTSSQTGQYLVQRPSRWSPRSSSLVGSR